MTTEATGLLRRYNFKLPSRQRQRVPSADVPNDQPGRMPESVYRTILGIDTKLKSSPDKYNIGEILLEPKAGLDTHLYEGRDLKTLEDVQSLGSFQTGEPYIARGIFDVDTTGKAVLLTATTSIDLGEIGPDAQSRLTTELRGREMVVPVVIDEITEEVVRGRVGERAAYLIPNPDRWTQRRLGKLVAQGLVEGLVRDVDPYEAEKMRVQTTPGGKWIPGKKVDVIIGKSVPLLDQGTKEMPTQGEQVQQKDKVRVPVLFAGREVFLEGNSSLITFSREHDAAYKVERQAISLGLDLMGSLLSEKAPNKITTPNGKEFDVSDAGKKASVVRYLFAELRQRQQLLSPEQQKQMFDYVFAMDPSERPFVFHDMEENNEPDPRRDELDRFFRRSGFETPVPKLVESMTPQQLFAEMMHIAAFDDFPPSVSNMADIINEYQGQFGEGASIAFINSVLVSREEQLRTGSNPEVAMFSLLEILPHLKEQDSVYQAEWLAHIVYAGLSFATMHQETLSNYPELHILMQNSLDGLGGAVFTDKEFYGVNYDAIFALLPFVDYMRKWPESLPFELGKNETLLYILRDLELMNAAKGEQNRVDHLTKVRDGLQRL